MHDDIPPTSLGLLRCLQALAEEAASLGLTRTYLTLQETIDACRAEAGLAMALGSRRSATEPLH